MKKKILAALAVLTTIVLVACGPVTSSSVGGSSSRAATSKASRHVHTWDDGVITTAPTCDVAGLKTYTCTGCGETKTEPIPSLGHTWGDAVPHLSDTETDYSVKVCSVCNKKAVILDALDYVDMTGSNKDRTGETLKLSSNNDYVDYSFTYEGTLSGKIYIYGWVDYWKDGSNNNDQKGFTSRKSGDGFNLEVTVNDAVVEITNTKSYEEMGMTEGEGGNGSFTLCELGAASLVNGVNNVRYKRIESYNLNITEIYFI